MRPSSPGNSPSPSRSTRPPLAHPAIEQGIDSRRHIERLAAASHLLDVSPGGHQEADQERGDDRQCRDDLKEPSDLGGPRSAKSGFSSDSAFSGVTCPVMPAKKHPFRRFCRSLEPEGIGRHLAILPDGNPRFSCLGVPGTRSYPQESGSPPAASTAPAARLRTERQPPRSGSCPDRRRAPPRGQTVGRARRTCWSSRVIRWTASRSRAAR